jgi:fructose-bisphosphate aldolase class II
MTTPILPRSEKLSGITNLRSCLDWAKANKVAIGHFNISNLETLQAIAHTAKALDVPVVIGVSEGERDAIGVLMTRNMVTTIAKELNHPIFLNADHTYSFERVKEAIDTGFDSVIIDAAKLTMEENIGLTRKCVAYAKSIHSETGREVLIEGELGYIGQSSKMLDAIPEGVGLDPASLTSASQVSDYVQETKVDLVAPAVGNIHGLIRGGNPKLNIERIREVSTASPAGIVLHGASGIALTDLQEAVEAGVIMVHYNTELRAAFTSAQREFFAKNKDEITPFKCVIDSIAAVSKIVEEKLKIMNKLI